MADSFQLRTFLKGYGCQFGTIPKCNIFNRCYICGYYDRFQLASIKHLFPNGYQCIWKNQLFNICRFTKCLCRQCRNIYLCNIEVFQIGHHAIDKQEIDIIQHTRDFQRFDIGIIIIRQHIFQFTFRFDMYFGTRSQLSKNNRL